MQLRARLRATRLPRPACLTLAALALAIAGLLLGLRLAGATAHDTALGRVSFDVEPSLSGGVEAYVPVADWGLRAPAFDGPFKLRVELRTLDRQALLDAAAGDRSQLERARADLREGASDATLRALVWAGAATAVLCLLALFVSPAARRAKAALPLATAAAFVVIAGGGLLLARATFDEAALHSPTYYAHGAELERLLAAAETERVRSGYGSELESVLRSVSTVLADEPVTRPGERQLFLGSDLHANALVIDPLAAFFAGAPVLLAGDFGQRGTRPEASLIAPQVAALGNRVIAVSGNHDSALFMRALADHGVTVLGERVENGFGESAPRARRARGSPSVVDVDGLKVAGFPDPFEARDGDPGAPDRPLDYDELPDGEALAERSAERLRRWFAALPRSPDVVMVHQSPLADSLAGSLYEDGYSQPLVIATGHDHEQHVERYGAITVVDGGTVGAGGVFDAAVAFSGLAHLYFDEDRPVLRSVDLIAVEPFSGRARGARVVIDSLCPGEDRCTYRPGDPEVSVGEGA
jgi:predicted phosphodiesterase